MQRAVWVWLLFGRFGHTSILHRLGLTVVSNGLSVEKLDRGKMLRKNFVLGSRINDDLNFLEIFYL